MTNANVWSYEQVMERLPEIVAEYHVIEPEEVTPDMPACEESIDLLDLNFRCEKEFAVKSPFKFLLGSRDQLTVTEAGFLTEESQLLLKQTYPFFAESLDQAVAVKFQAVELFNLLTVDMVARFVVHASAQQAANTQAA